LHAQPSPCCHRGNHFASVEDSYDNALAETINGLFKAEVIHRHGPWRNFEAVEYATLVWVDWFNNRRLLKPIGNIPPAEAEANVYAVQFTASLSPATRIQSEFSISTRGG
jgi:transposase InsO family protein